MHDLCNFIVCRFLGPVDLLYRGRFHNTKEVTHVTRRFNHHR